MHREIKRQEKRLPDEESLTILKDGEYGVMATLGKEGTPYAVPLNYAFHEGKIIFHCATSGHKLDNIAHCDRVSFCVVKQATLVPEKFSTHFQSVIAFGRARVLEGAEKKEGLLALVQRLSPAHVPSGEKYIENAWEKTTVVAIDVERVTGKAAPNKS